MPKNEKEKLVGRIIPIIVEHTGIMVFMKMELLVLWIYAVNLGRFYEFIQRKLFVYWNCRPQKIHTI